MPSAQTFGIMATPPAPTFSLSDHRIVKTDDVLCEIFWALESDHFMSVDEIRSNRRALVRAARACKAFRQPALDVLWSYQDSFMPLFRLLGPAFVDIGKAGGSSFDIRGTIDANRWRTFLNRAHGIRSLVVVMPHAICRHAFMRLSHKAGGPILVNLRSFSTTITPEREIEFSLLSLPHLHRIEINSISKGTVSMVESLCTDLEESPHHLQSLSLCGDESSPVTSCTLKSIKELTGLTSLKISGKFVPMDMDFLVHLGTLQSLSSLDIQCIKGRFNVSGGIKGFPSLSDFKLTTSDVRLAEDFFRGIHSRNLSRVHVAVTATGSEDILKRLIQAIFWDSRLARSRNLLTLCYEDVTLNGSPKIPIDYTGYFPSDVGRLQCLEIHSPRYNIDTTSRTFVSGAYYRSSLVTLILPLVPGFQPMGLGELASVVNNHPKLTSLQIYISPQDCRTPLPTQNPSPSLRSQIKTLSLGSAVVFSSMDEAIGIAEYLDRLCPYLSDLTGDGEQVGGWGQVFKLIRSYQEVRRVYYA
ncbi:hypothetical protein BDN72DRAFT_838344 [Pluteus cervinus]|uniref:Uncharacterized protein n=1 Tax=Pluteus cervinus TaxID=181527 RepID=A0ACD3AZB6_9AGAR|nr:hypothetical protein BDN72DRAFT_838344 [Pluteus cervinus]